MSPPAVAARRCPTAAASLPALLLLVLPGCVTADLWGHRLRMRGSGAERWVACEPKRYTEWQSWRVGLRVAATPATLALDVVTLPLQAVVVGGVAPLR